MPAPALLKHVWRHYKPGRRCRIRNFGDTNTGRVPEFFVVSTGLFPGVSSIDFAGRRWEHHREIDSRGAIAPRVQCAVRSVLFRLGFVSGFLQDCSGIDGRVEGFGKHERSAGIPTWYAHEPPGC